MLDEWGWSRLDVADGVRIVSIGAGVMVAARAMGKVFGDCESRWAWPAVVCAFWESDRASWEGRWKKEFRFPKLFSVL